MRGNEGARRKWSIEGFREKEIKMDFGRRGRQKHGVKGG